MASKAIEFGEKKRYKGYYAVRVSLPSAELELMIRFSPRPRIFRRAWP